MTIKRINITFEDGSVGIVTDMFDEDGDEVELPWHCAVAVGQYVDGPHAGKWFTTDVRGLEWSGFAS